MNDGFLTSLKSLKDFYKNNMYLVFGCGGDRDKGKRSMMGESAKFFCKKIYITDDNPRNENPKKIRNAIIKNLAKESFIDIADRTKAIETAIQNSEP